LPDWRGELTKLLDNLESAKPTDVVRVALLIPEDKVAEVRVFLAGVTAALGDPRTRPGSGPRKIEAPRDETLGMAEAANYLKVSRKTVRGLVGRGRLHPARLTRKSWVFSRRELEKYLEATRQ
jgi:excisionase family DNA binding protein